MSPASSSPETAPAAEATLPAREEIVALCAIVEGTAQGTGQEFFQSLVRHLAAAIDVRFAFVAEFAGVPTRVRTLAYSERDRIADKY